MSSWRYRFGHIYRTLLLNGSPANRVAKWTFSLILAGSWIYSSEKKKPRRRGIFFRDKTAPLFEAHEIHSWNENHKRIRLL